MKHTYTVTYTVVCDEDPRPSAYRILAAARNVMPNLQAELTRLAVHSTVSVVVRSPARHHVQLVTPK